MAARLIVIVEIVISLRFLPSGCFKAVQWSRVFLTAINDVRKLDVCIYA